MKALLKRLAIIFGIVSLILPVLIGMLWLRYVKEQERILALETLTGQGCEPYAFRLDRQGESLAISWKTDDLCAGFLLLGRTYADFTSLPYKVLSSAGETPATDHVVTILPEDEAQYRYLVVVSAGEWYGSKGNPLRFKN